MNLRQPVHKPASSSDHPMARHSPAKATYSKKAKEKIGDVMEEHAAGTLKHGGTGKPVPKNRPDIAKAIALSQAREAGLKVPKKKRKK